MPDVSKLITKKLAQAGYTLVKDMRALHRDGEMHYVIGTDGNGYTLFQAPVMGKDVSLSPMVWNAKLDDAMDYAYERTSGYNERFLNMAIAYGGRQDIANAVRAIAQDAVDGKISVDEIDEDTVSGYISTTGMPDPDLVLRTSGEVRVSNFLLWQLAYSELYFTDVYWPGFRHIDLLRAIRTYQQRVRRFGR